MSQFQLFDRVQLMEPVAINSEQILPVGTVGAMVEVLQSGKAFLVEWFGDWVKLDDQGSFVAAAESESDAFVEPLRDVLEIKVPIPELNGSHLPTKLLAL